MSISGATFQPGQGQADHSAERLLWTDNTLTVPHLEITRRQGRSALRVSLAGKVGSRNAVGAGLLMDGPRGTCSLEYLRIAEDATPREMETGMPADFIGSLRFIDASTEP